MKRLMMWSAIALMMAATYSACSNSDDDVTPDEPLSNENNELRYISLTRAESELVNENNNFAFNLFRQVASNQSEIVSPISITQLIIVNYFLFHAVFCLFGVL